MNGEYIFKCENNLYFGCENNNELMEFLLISFMKK